MGTQLYTLRGSPVLQGLPQLTGGREYTVVDISLTGLPGWGVAFLLRFEKMSWHSLQADSAVAGQHTGWQPVWAACNSPVGMCLSKSTVDWLSLVSYPVDKIPSHFLGDFHQRNSELSSIRRMSLQAAGCLLDMSFGSVCKESLKGR